MYDPVIQDRKQWTADLLPGSSRWSQAPSAPLPETLCRWFVDLRLLRHVPFHYLVPVPEMLPIESVRFFYVDPTFPDRLIDGALAAANLGAMDQALAQHTAASVRQQVDDALAAQAGLPAGSWKGVTLTGLLIRSSLVRRWPGLEVRAYTTSQATTRLPLMRLERIGESILIALFAGVPQRVEVQEPNEGTHFGVTLEPSPPGSCSIRPRNDLDQWMPKIGVPFRGAAALRLIDLEALSTGLGQALGVGAGGIESSRLAHSLQRAPYVQVFQGGSSQDDAFLDGLTAALDAAIQGGP